MQNSMKIVITFTPLPSQMFSSENFVKGRIKILLTKNIPNKIEIILIPFKIVQHILFLIAYISLSIYAIEKHIHSLIF